MPTATSRALRAATFVFVVSAASLSVFAQGGGRGQIPARDPAARRPAAPAGTASISGRVITADTGRPMKRARVQLQSTQSGGRTAITDAAGGYEFTELPAGRYTRHGEKDGLRQRVVRTAPAAAGEHTDRRRRPSDDQERRSPAAARQRDYRPRLRRDGEPIAQVAVRVMRWAFQQGERRLSPVGNDQTDDRGAFRVFGRQPGDYVVSAISRSGDLIASVRGAVTSALAAVAAVAAVAEAAARSSPIRRGPPPWRTPPRTTRTSVRADLLSGRHHTRRSRQGVGHAGARGQRDRLRAATGAYGAHERHGDEPRGTDRGRHGDADVRGARRGIPRST